MDFSKQGTKMEQTKKQVLFSESNCFYSYFFSPGCYIAVALKNRESVESIGLYVLERS